MWPGFLLHAALTLGQAEKAAEAPPPPPPPPATDRWLLMKSLQGTWPGWLLDGNRMQIYGWTELSFTGSSDRERSMRMSVTRIKAMTARPPAVGVPPLARCDLGPSSRIR